MHIESGTPLTRFVSGLVTLAALVAVGFLIWKTFNVWQADPSVKGIEQILEKKQ